MFCVDDNDLNFTIDGDDEEGFNCCYIILGFCWFCISLIVIFYGVLWVYLNRFLCMDYDCYKGVSLVNLLHDVVDLANVLY